MSTIVLLDSRLMPRLPTLHLSVWGELKRYPASGPHLRTYCLSSFLSAFYLRWHITCYYFGDPPSGNQEGKWKG